MMPISTSPSLHAPSCSTELGPSQVPRILVLGPALAIRLEDASSERDPLLWHS